MTEAHTARTFPISEAEYAMRASRYLLSKTPDENPKLSECLDAGLKYLAHLETDLSAALAQLRQAREQNAEQERIIGGVRHENERLRSNVRKLATALERAKTAITANYGKDQRDHIIAQCVVALTTTAPC